MMILFDLLFLSFIHLIILVIIIMKIYLSESFHGSK
jgi:hypothetical protein